MEQFLEVQTYDNCEMTFINKYCSTNNKNYADKQGQMQAAVVRPI